MRAFRFLNLAILSVLVGTAALAYAQDEKPQDDKPARQEEAKPQPKQDEAKSAPQEEAKPTKQDNQEMKQEQKDSHDQAKPEMQEHPAEQTDHARPMAQDQEHPAPHAENAHPAGKGGHIPDNKFKAHFGRSHSFRAQTVIVSGRPQFQYGGYNFELVDPWPAGWAYTDDCYIDYIDGQYYLIDLLHPGVRIAVFVVL